MPVTDHTGLIRYLDFPQEVSKALMLILAPICYCSNRPKTIWHISCVLKIKFLPSSNFKRSWKSTKKKQKKHEPWYVKTNKVSVRPAKTQISLGIPPVWSESSLSAWRNLGPVATHWAHSEDSNQTGLMPRLVWVFAGRTLILLVLSCRGYIITKTREWTIGQFKVAWSLHATCLVVSCICMGKLLCRLIHLNGEVALSSHAFEWESCFVASCICMDKLFGRLVNLYGQVFSGRLMHLFEGCLVAASIYMGKLIGRLMHLHLYGQLDWSPHVFVWGSYLVVSCTCIVKLLGPLMHLNVQVDWSPHAFLWFVWGSYLVASCICMPAPFGWSPQAFVWRSCLVASSICMGKKLGRLMPFYEQVAWSRNTFVSGSCLVASCICMGKMLGCLMHLYGQIAWLPHAFVWGSCLVASYICMGKLLGRLMHLYG